MRAGALLFCLFFVCPLFADIQDSLFEKALDAESAGDVPSTIALLEEAYSYKGNYNAEIRKILNSYYDALQIKDSISPMSVDFLIRAEGVGIQYNEYGDSSGANEKSGETYLFFGADLGFHGTSGIARYLLVSFASDIFFREKETVFDTSRWAFTPSVEYTVQGERFLIVGNLDALISEKDGVVLSAAISGERDFYYAKDYRAGVSWFGYVNENKRVRLKSGLYWEYRPTRGFWTNISLGARFDGDTSVPAYFSEIVRPDSTGGEGFGDVPHRDSAAAPVADTLWQRYYLGRNVKLGPEARFQMGWHFSDMFSLDFLGGLFFPYSLYRDSWRYFEDFGEGDALWVTEYYRRQFLQGSVRLRADVRGDVFGVYLSVGSHFQRYFNLPENHPELTSHAYILNEVRLGVSLRF